MAKREFIAGLELNIMDRLYRRARVTFSLWGGHGHEYKERPFNSFSQGIFLKKACLKG
jgi:hypothetical protein